MHNYTYAYSREGLHALLEDHLPEALRGLRPPPQLLIYINII